MKTCLHCGEDKPESEFFANTTDRKVKTRPECKVCTKKRRNQKARTEYMRNWRRSKSDNPSNR